MTLPAPARLPHPDVPTDFRLSFSGTRNGMTAAQKAAFGQLVERLQPTMMRQGCCLGADEDATVIVNRLRPSPLCRIIGHPGKSARGGINENRSEKAVGLSDDVMEEDFHFARNRTMVQFCDELVATPWQTKEREPGPGTGGGTWFTIQHAVKVGRKVTIIWPDGEVETR